MPTGKGWLRTALEDWLKEGFIGRIIRGGIVTLVETFEKSTADIADGIIQRITDLDFDDPEVKNILIDLLSGRSQGGSASVLGFGWSAGSQVAGGFLAPFQRIANYAIDSRVRSNLLDIISTTVAQRRVSDPNGFLEKHKDMLGYSTFLQGVVDEMTKPVLPEEILVTLWLREILSENQLDTELRKRGWTDERIEQLKDVRQIIPPAPDLISMAVKGAFNPEEVSTFQLDGDFPEEFATWAGRVGLSREWALNYWRSHWRLPGIVQAFEMLHRLRPGEVSNPFTQNDLNVFLKAADISPRFRDWLTQISFSPFTRVDVRRMYDEGILSYDQVVAAHKDIGYNDEKARLLADWVARDRAAANKGISRSTIEKAYRLKNIDFDTALGMLTSIGYDHSESEFFLTIIDWQDSLEQLEDAIDGIRFRYVEAEIGRDEVYNELNQLNVPSEQVERLITVWDIQVKKKTAVPSRSELDDFYERSIITADEYREGLQRKRYSEENITRFIFRIDEIKADNARKEAERANKEAERARDDDLASEYILAKTAVDVQIAELNLLLAELKVLINEATEDTDAVLFAKRRDEVKVEIRELRLIQATLRHDLEKEQDENADQTPNT